MISKKNIVIVNVKTRFSQCTNVFRYLLPITQRYNKASTNLTGVSEVRAHKRTKETVPRSHKYCLLWVESNVVLEFDEDNYNHKCDTWVFAMYYWFQVDVANDTKV